MKFTVNIYRKQKGPCDMLIFHARQKMGFQKPLFSYSIKKSIFVFSYRNSSVYI